MHALIEASEQTDLVQDTVHFVQFFILVLQQFFPAKENEIKDDNVIMVINAIRFMVIKLKF